MNRNYLLLIRHANVVIEPEKPASTWILSDEGRSRAKFLMAHLRPYHPERVIASIEPKAAETGEIIARELQIPFATAPNLHEHERSHVPFENRERFESKVHDLFAFPNRLMFGDETADQAHSRFASVIDQLLIQFPAQNLAVVTHGTVLTLFISRRSQVEPFDFWKQLGLPALVVLGLPDFQCITVINEIERL